jgi:hypothetical protein
MSQAADKAAPGPSADEKEEKEEGDSQPVEEKVKRKASKPKLRRVKTESTSKPKPKPKRRSDDNDVVPESSGTIRRRKSSMSTKSGPSRHSAAASQGPNQHPYASPSDPRPPRSDFVPPKYPVSASGYGPPPHPAIPQANQAKHFTQPARFHHPNPAAPYGWGPQQLQQWHQQGWNAYGQPIPPVRPQMPSLPGFRTPVRRPPPSPLEQEYAKMKRELDEIKAEQERDKKRREKIERDRLRAAKRAAEHEAIRQKTIEEMGPIMEQYLRMTSLAESRVASQDAFWEPSSRGPRAGPGYDMGAMQPQHIPRNVMLDREHGSAPTMDEFLQFVQWKRSMEGQWPYGQTMYSGESVVGSGPQSADLSPQPQYSPMDSPTSHSQLEATVANMLPHLLQQMQQGTHPDHSHQPRSRNVAAEAADHWQIFQVWNEQNARKDEQPARARTPKPRKATVDSGYVSVTNAEASSNSSRPRKTKARKKLSTRRLREEAEMAYGQSYAEDEEEFEMIPGRKPTPYGFSGVWAPDPPVYQ